MRILLPAVLVALIVSVELIAQGPAPGAAPPEPQIVWSPKAAAPPDWTAPNRPHKKLSELLAKHKGQSEWTETMVDDDTLHADYVAMAPGGKTPRRMNTDTREWWAVQDGQIRTEGGNKPYVDFNAVVAGTDRTRQFVNDARAVANIILGRGIPPPPPTDKGHFHTESSEFWFILLGQIRYTIEGLPTFIADQGDIVYVPKQRWHLASLAGDGMSARLAMNGYPDLAHSFEAPDSGEATR